MNGLVLSDKKKVASEFLKNFHDIQISIWNNLKVICYACIKKIQVFLVLFIDRNSLECIFYAKWCKVAIWKYRMNNLPDCLHFRMVFKTFLI